MDLGDVSAEGSELARGIDVGEEFTLGGGGDDVCTSASEVVYATKGVGE